MTGKLLVASYSTPRSELAAGPHLNPDGRASLLDGPRGGDASDSVPLPLSFPSFDRILVMELAGSP